MNGLGSKVILVCGGATGIGAATAVRLCEEGARVAIGDRAIERATALAEEQEQAGFECGAWHFDQSDDASIERLVEDCIGRFGRVDGLVANVADLDIVLRDADLLFNDAAVWERTLRVNVTGTAMLIRAVLPRMLAQGSGAIVCTSSVASVIGEFERPAYAASKAAVGAICRHVASKWGRDQIRCNAVAPGLVMTEALEANVPDEVKQRALERSPSFRHGRPTDIASATAFLLSDDAEWVNGQVWHVNGGVHYGL